MGIGIAVEVPGRIDKGVHGVGLAARRSSTARTGRVHERGNTAERGSVLLRDLDLLRQQDGELIIGHGHDAVFGTVEHGDGRAPVALAADSPVLQAKRNRGFSEAVLLGEGGQLLLRLLAAQGVVFAGVDQQAVFFGVGQHVLVRLAAGGRLLRAPGQNHDAHFQPVFFCELEIALVVSRHRHDGAGSVFQQDVVGHPDRHALSAEGIDSVVAGEDTVLIDGSGIAGFAGFLLFFDQGGDFLGQPRVGLGKLLD